MTKKCAGCGKEANLVVGIGPVLLCREECYPAAAADREATQAAGQQFDITAWAHKHLRGDYSTPRVNERNARLNAKAKSLGYDSYSSILTAWDKGEIDIPPNPNTAG